MAQLLAGSCAFLYIGCNMDKEKMRRESSGDLSKKSPLQKCCSIIAGHLPGDKVGIIKGSFLDSLRIALSARSTAYIYGHCRRGRGRSGRSSDAVGPVAPHFPICVLPPACGRSGLGVGWYQTSVG